MLESISKLLGLIHQVGKVVHEFLYRNLRYIGLGKLYYIIVQLSYTIARKIYIRIRRALTPNPVICDGSKFCWTPKNFEVVAYINSIHRSRFEPHTTAFIQSYLKEGMVMLDVGAHIGYHSILSAHLVGKTGKIIAIEPTPETYDCLVKNITINELGATIRPINKIASYYSGVRELHLDPVDFSGNSLFGEGIGVCIICDTVDNILADLEVKELNLAKIDVEGSELWVLKGMSKTLQANNTALILEINAGALEKAKTNPGELVNLLVDYGYTKIGFDDEELQSVDKFLNRYFLGINSLPRNIICLK